MAELVFNNNVRRGYRGVVTRKVREVDTVLAADPNPDKVGFSLRKMKFLTVQVLSQTCSPSLNSYYCCQSLVKFAVNIILK